MRFKVKKSTHSKKLDIKRLHNTEVKECYEIKLKNSFEVLGNTIEESSLDYALDIMLFITALYYNGMIKKTAEEIISIRRYKKRFVDHRQSPRTGWWYT